MPAEEFDAAVADWAAKLASKSPVLMRLGHDAMYRQQDMALDDALEYLRSQLSLTFTTEDIVEGVQAFFEKREPNGRGVMTTRRRGTRARRRRSPQPAKEAEAPEAPAEVEAGEQTGMKRSSRTSTRAARRRSSAAARRRSPLQHERGKLTARERIDLLVDPGTFVEIGIHGRPALLAALDGGQGGARRRRDHRLGRRRRPHLLRSPPTTSR